MVDQDLKVFSRAARFQLTVQIPKDAGRAASAPEPSKGKRVLKLGLFLQLLFVLDAIITGQLAD